MVRNEYKQRGNWKRKRGRRNIFRKEITKEKNDNGKILDQTDGPNANGKQSPTELFHCTTARAVSFVTPTIGVLS